jgi:hypothetical protein
MKISLLKVMMNEGHTSIKKVKKPADLRSHLKKGFCNANCSELSRFCVSVTT